MLYQENEFHLSRIVRDQEGDEHQILNNGTEIIPHVQVTPLEHVIFCIKGKIAQILHAEPAAK
jgi:hypothetical protein